MCVLRIYELQVFVRAQNLLGFFSLSHDAGRLHGPCALFFFARELRSTNVVLRARAKGAGHPSSTKMGKYR